MNTKDDAIIKRKLAKLDKTADIIGAAVGVRPLGSGASWVASKLPTGTVREVITVADPAKIALEKVYKLLKKSGEIIDSKKKQKFPTLKAVVGSGFFNLNPTIVHLEIRPTKGGATELYLEASAKEGLLPQHSAEKAIKRIKQALKK